LSTLKTTEVDERLGGQPESNFTRTIDKNKLDRLTNTENLEHLQQESIVPNSFLRKIDIFSVFDIKLDSFMIIELFYYVAK
jgi:hypothetical protein